MSDNQNSESGNVNQDDGDAITEVIELDGSDDDDEEQEVMQVGSGLVQIENVGRVPPLLVPKEEKPKLPKKRKADKAEHYYPNGKNRGGRGGRGGGWRYGQKYVMEPNDRNDDEEQEVMQVGSGPVQIDNVGSVPPLLVPKEEKPKLPKKRKADKAEHYYPNGKNRGGRGGRGGGWRYGQKYVMEPNDRNDDEEQEVMQVGSGPVQIDNVGSVPPLLVPKEEKPKLPKKRKADKAEHYYPNGKKRGGRGGRGGGWRYGQKYEFHFH